jgi:hypothetical protein
MWQDEIEQSSRRFSAAHLRPYPKFHRTQGIPALACISGKAS